MWPILLAGAINAGTQIYSGYQQKEASIENAKLVREQGRFQKRQAYDQASNIGVQGEAAIGRQKSAFASSGVKIDSGSPLAVLNESRKSLQRDISRTRQAGNNALTQSLNQSKDILKQGKNALTSSVLSAGTTLLTAGANSGAFNPASPGTTTPPGNIAKGGVGPWSGADTTQRGVSAGPWSGADSPIVPQATNSLMKPKRWQDQFGPVWSN